MAKNELLKKAINEIKLQNEFLQSEIAEKLGIKSTYLSDMINGRVPLSDNIAEKICELFHINKSWLLTGEGDMLKTKKIAPRNDVQPIDINLFINAPMITVSAQAGYLLGYGDQEYIEGLPTFPVIADKEFRGNYRVFEIKGDSMDDGSRDAVCDGDRVLCREVKHDLWKSKLHIRNWDFVIVHRTEGITIKRIIEHKVDEGIIVCHPLNTLYDDFEIHLDDVLELYNAINVVYRNMRR